jgi:hypothetical protein
MCVVYRLSTCGLVLLGFKRGSSQDLVNVRWEGGGKSCGVFTCSFRNVSDNFAWAFAGVYGPNINHERMLLWDELARLLNW